VNTVREVDNDYWAKFQDGIIISFDRTNGWCATIREGSMGSGQTIDEAIANLRAQWEEKNVVPDHSPDAAKMIGLEAENKELAEALELLMSDDATEGCDEYRKQKARAILAKHNATK